MKEVEFMTNIKICVSHRIDLDSTVIKNDIFLPVYCGAIYKKDEWDKNVIGDNTGDNISEKRDSFCELTVQYWAWKNLEADYYGLCHYRRYLSFSNRKYNNYDNRRLLSEKYMSNLEKYNLNTEKEVRNIVENNEIILPEYIDIKKIDTINGKKDNVLEHWKAWDNCLIKEEYLDILLNLIKEYSLELFNYAIKYLHGSKYRGYNCFVMKKKYFFDMCEFQFNILFKIEKIIDNTYFGETLNRIIGYFGEILFGIYCYYLENKLDIRVKTVQLVFFANTDKEKILYPIKKYNNIPIVLMSSDYFSPYLGVFIKSLINKSSKEYNYDIIIFEREISKRNKILLEQLVKDYSNIKIRFYNPQRKINDIKLYVASVNFAYEAYYRIFSPWLLPNYDKAIVMDCDIILNKDIAELYNINIDNYLAAAVKDIIYQGFLNSFENKDDWIKYSKDELNLDNPYDYINTGVLLLNLKKMREQYSFDDIIDLAKKSKFRFQEQDIFNILLKNNILFIPRSWNFGVESNLPTKICHELSPIQSYREYLETKSNPFIIHYMAKPKPWEDPNIDFADKFWDIAKQTVFYEIILVRLSTNYTKIIMSEHNVFYHNGIISKNKKQKIKNFIKMFLPKGTKRHRFVKKLYFKLRGWPFVE